MTSPAVIHGTEQHIVHSDAVGADFEITVMAPPPELQAGPTPVIYGTDANLALGLYASTVTLLSAGGEIPPVTMVGIGYPIGADMSAFAALRTRDFSPDANEWQLGVVEAFAMGHKVEGGGAPQFLEVLTTELRAFISDNSDGPDNATYVGDSLGGLFGTYTLLNQPEAFDRYIIGSPWLSWDRDLCFGWEEAYAASHDDLAAKVFYACGAAEDVLSPLVPKEMTKSFERGDVAALTDRMATRLASRCYPSLDLTARIYPEQTHYTVPAIIYAQGLREVFKAERLAR